MNTYALLSVIASVAVLSACGGGTEAENTLPTADTTAAVVDTLPAAPEVLAIVIGEHAINDVSMVRAHHEARRKGAAVETIRGADVLVAPDLAGLDLDTLDSEDQPAPQVRVKRFAMKPMHLDEAIEQMELLGHDFFLFRNADTGHSAVVYQRANGDYGLIMDDNA